MNKNGQAAAFYDLEGTLVSTNLVHTLAFYAKAPAGPVADGQEKCRDARETAVLWHHGSLFAKRI